MERRLFLRWFGTGVLATSLPVAIAACFSDETSQKTTSSESETAPETANNEPDAEGFVTVGALAALDKDGYIIDKKREAIIVRKDDNSLSAVNIKCTHQQCDVEWRDGDKNLSCPCHGSKFAPDGTVVDGPAESPLASYEVKEKEGAILIKAS